MIQKHNFAAGDLPTEPPLTSGDFWMAASIVGGMVLLLLAGPWLRGLWA